MNRFTCVVVGCLITIAVIIVGLILLPLESELWSKNYYRAAVVEVVPYRNSSLTVEQVVKKNLETYALAAAVAASEGADIIIFPESVLYLPDHESDHLIVSTAEDIPDPKLGEHNPCMQKEKYHNNTILRNLSCLAKDGGFYLVANMVDYKFCNKTNETDISSKFFKNPDCSEDGINFFNANVVFNREGVLVSRYHKKHLFYDIGMSPSKCTTDNGYFLTDFGSFISTICFDLTFKQTVDAIETTHADNVAYPVYWYDHAPMFFSTMSHQSFAIANKVNLLSANGHYPSTGTLGSGIYSGSNGALIVTYSPDNRSKVLISNVPKQPKSSSNFYFFNRKKYIIENGHYVEDDSVENVEFQNECEIVNVSSARERRGYNCFPVNFTSYAFRKLERVEDTVEICANSFCCSLSYKMMFMDGDYFLTATTEDFNFYGVASKGMETCFMIRCESYDGKRCSHYTFKSNALFEKAELKGNFTTKYVHPFAVDSNNRLTKKSKWDFDGLSQIVYRNSRNNSNLLLLGLLGRKYENDRMYFN